MNEFGEILDNDDSLAENILRCLGGSEGTFQERGKEGEDGRCDNGDKSCLTKRFLDKVIKY